MLEPDAARARILAALEDVAPLPPERVSLAEALGRALAEPVLAPRALPPFDSSQMDGYALRAADARAPGARLRVAFEVYAGSVPPPLPEGACCRIFTGAPVPAGADAVEMQEEVARQGAFARFRRAAEPGRFVRPAGSDLALGAVALEAGAAVDAGATGLAAALGRTELAVYRRPRVGLLATGDELVPVDRPPAAGQILDSNSHALAAACREAGAVPLLLPFARDERGSLRRALAAARGLDALVSTGGVSVGEKDLVKEAVEAAGARLDFWKVAMKPGKPVAFGRWGRTAVFGLPGNPASALVTFELFVRPALRRLAGLPGTGRVRLPARLAEPASKPAGLTHFLRARATVRAGQLWVEPLRSQASGHLTSVTGFEALAVLPSAATRLRRGAAVEAILLAPPREP
ncbi:molybdopterin molybdotransferase MoeA [Anaeromyxobacter diazotrophicus]|uniref:Molybdopterin molybdenumtransferase n=1 Tax=Anaeromyxobacter diazotrophicus TaxID=2590199 RepID=A0A7I9VJP8_9BACT|nr:gephyrin-like molybdotransferase Glp [Anaeromyxobacter diazotrophicus]GEJ56398.1 molybdopterin molybdenumtransferase MoeA [Anaeromyxobacter diazotrophicus]